jgi:hypothetical protein
VRGHEHCPALGGQALEQGADPQHAFRVQSVDGLVEQDGRRISQQRAGDAEALAHAERERAGPRSGDVGESDLIDDLPDPAAADLRCSGPRLPSTVFIVPTTACPVAGERE